MTLGRIEDLALGLSTGAARSPLQTAPGRPASTGGGGQSDFEDDELGVLAAVVLDFEESDEVDFESDDFESDDFESDDFESDDFESDDVESDDVAGVVEDEAARLSVR